MVISIALACHLAVISWIDFRRYVIPNLLNLPLALFGFAVSVVVLDKTVVSVLIEGGFTIVVFLLFAKCYNIMRKRQGIGAGDVKFLGAAATWVGVLGMPWVILFASISGLLFAVAAKLHGRNVDANSRIAFGPHLALGLMLTWLFRDVLYA